MRRVTLWLVALVLTSCSSASAPGAGDVVDQLDKAKQVQVEADLRQVVVAEEAYYAQNTAYTTDLTLLQFTPNDDVSVTIVRADANGFCAEGSHVDAPDAELHVENGTSTIEDGPCPT